MTNDIEYDLEQIVDRVGLTEVLAILSEICSAKASHVEENWQDKVLAKRWEKAHKIVEQAGYKALATLSD